MLNILNFFLQVKKKKTKYNLFQYYGHEFYYAVLLFCMII